MHRTRRAKIVATLGPASADLDMIRRLFIAGADVFRMNFSHGTREDHAARFAVVRAIEIIGEAASRVTPDGRARIVGIPWPAIISMRNRMVHAYFDIDHDVVWQTVQTELNPLLSVLEHALRQTD